MDVLLDDGIQSAKHFLETRGEFFPFAVVMKRNGEIKHVQLYPEDERPSSDAVVEKLVTALRQTRAEDDLISIAIVSDVRLPKFQQTHEVDAIRVELDDLEAQPVTCYLPYELASGVIALGEMRATRGESRVFR
ncbi:MAG: hypothetical protein FD124_2051 [Alphaproteobacteria bacterium]|nr:MAG: hypothetical protein FD124_2051 [Alphaproteobacteria bacterium]